MFLGVLAGITDTRGSEGHVWRYCSSQKVWWVAGAGGKDSKMDTAREMRPSFASDSALCIALSTCISCLLI